MLFSGVKMVNETCCPYFSIIYWRVYAPIAVDNGMANESAEIQYDMERLCAHRGERFVSVPLTTRKCAISASKVGDLRARSRRLLKCKWRGVRQNVNIFQIEPDTIRVGQLLFLIQKIYL